MLSPHILQALVIADHAARLRAEADGARLARAASATGSSSPASPALARLTALLRRPVSRRDSVAPARPRAAIASPLPDCRRPAPGC